MDTNQLHELATNARLNHWPPHLGVKTDVEKVEYLAERLREVADMATTNDELLDQVRELRTKIEDLELDFESKIEDLKDDLEKIETEAEGE